MVNERDSQSAEDQIIMVLLHFQIKTHRIGVSDLQYILRHRKVTHFAVKNNARVVSISLKKIY